MPKIEDFVSTSGEVLRELFAVAVLNRLTAAELKRVLIAIDQEKSQ